MEVLIYPISKEPTTKRINMPERLRDIPSFYGGFWNKIDGTPYLNPIENSEIQNVYIDSQQFGSGKVLDGKIEIDVKYDGLLEAFRSRNSEEIGIVVLKEDIKGWEKRLNASSRYFSKNNGKLILNFID